MSVPPALPQSASIISMWKFDGNSNDSSATANNGSDTNISYTTGLVLQGASFNGTSSEITTTTQYNNPTTFTILCVIKSNAGTSDTIISFSDAQTGDSGTFDRSFSIDSNGKLNFYVFDGSARNVTSTASVNDNTFKIVAVTCGSNDIILYINGVADGTGTYACQNTNGYWRIGRQSIAATRNWFTGIEDELILWNVVLTPAEIMQVVNLITKKYAGWGIPMGSPMIF